MMTDKTKIILYWTLGAIATVMVFGALIARMSGWHNDWLRLVVTSGFTIAFYAMLCEPITRKPDKIASSKNILFIAVIWGIFAVISILDIKHFTPVTITVAAINVLAMIVACFLANKKKQKAIEIEKELENEKNEG